MLNALGQIALVFASVGGLLAFIAGVRWLGAKWQWSAEVRRKAVHIATGCFAMLLPAIFSERWPVVLLVCCAIAVMAWMRLPGQRAGGLGSTLHSVERKSWGDVLLALAIGFLFLRSEGQIVLYVLPLAVITLSDSAAALAGSTYGRRVFAVEKGSKSIEGVVVFFMVTWLVAMIALLLLSDADRANVVLLGLAVAAFGAVVEADSWSGLDNVFVPIGIYVFLVAHLAAPVLDTAMLALLFGAAAIGFVCLAPQLRISTHAARGGALVLFLLASYSGWFAALLPTAALVGHQLARIRRPCASDWPDLDALAALAGAGALWLFLGESVGRSAIHFFMLTTANALAIYLLLAFRPTPARIGAIMAGVLVAAALLMQAGPDYAHWHRDIVGWAVVALAASVAVVVRRPDWFDRWRAARVFCLGAIGPLLIYLEQVAIT